MSIYASAAKPGIRGQAACGLLVAWLAGCGSSTSNPPPAAPAIAARPDVIVTLNGGRHDCLVALYSEAQGSTVPCDDVVRFVRDELRVANGSVYDIRTIATVDPAEMNQVASSLNGAGYRFIGGPHAPSTP